MPNIVIRSLTGIVFVSLIVFSVVISYWSFLLLFFLVGVFSLMEFYRLFKGDSSSVQIIPGVVVGACLYLSTSLFILDIVDSRLLLINLLCFVLVFIIELYRKNSSPFENIAITVLGPLYTCLPVALLSGFYQMDFMNSWVILIGFFSLIWTNDTAAYLTGISIGKHRLFERISPKKSWEGAIGGLVGSVLIAWVLSVFFDELSLFNWISIAVITVVFSVFGDLVESLLKRSNNKKDSGSFLPGHGGLLDRFDSVFLAAPAVFIYIKLMIG